MPSTTATTNDVSILQEMENASHELTNVLQIIRGYVSYVHKNLPKENDKHDDLEQTLIATDRAAKIAHHILKTARTENERNKTE